MTDVRTAVCLVALVALALVSYACHSHEDPAPMPSECDDYVARLGRCQDIHVGHDAGTRQSMALAAFLRSRAGDAAASDLEALRDSCRNGLEQLDARCTTPRGAQ